MNDERKSTERSYLEQVHLDPLDFERARAELLAALDAAREYVAAQTTDGRNPNLTDARILELYRALTRDRGLALSRRDADEVARDRARVSAQQLRRELRPGNLSGFAELFNRVKTHYEGTDCVAGGREPCGQCETCEVGLHEYRQFTALFGEKAPAAFEAMGNLRRVAGRPRKGAEDNSHEAVYRKLLGFLGIAIDPPIAPGASASQAPERRKLRGTLGASHGKKRRRQKLSEPKP